MVEILLDFIQAERTADWKAHLSAIASMLPFFFGMDRPNYSKWLPVYMTEMNQLCESHPSVYKEFMKGKHAVSRSTRPFSQVWTDMALEQSVNLDSKTQGGIVGISRKPGALESWFLTSHDRAAITTATKKMCGMQKTDDSGSHKKAGKQRMKRDEGDV